MNYVTSFIGVPPEYWITCIKQIRLFTDDPIWCITNHVTHEVIQTLSKISNVFCIDYETVKSEAFDDVVNRTRHKFCICHGLKGREELFIRSFERFFLCENLMRIHNLRNVFFLEIDNLIYDDASKFLSKFQEKPLAYMYDNDDRSSSGIMYIKEWNSLCRLNAYSMDYILSSNEFLNEMSVLYRYAGRYPEDVQYLPIHIPDETIPLESCINFEKFNVIFDAASLGVYLYGRDPYHTHGEIIKHLKNPYSKIDFTEYEYSIQIDEYNRKTHWIKFKNGQSYKIFNLHIHSKNLIDAFSIIAK